MMTHRVLLPLVTRLLVIGQQWLDITQKLAKFSNGVAVPLTSNSLQSARYQWVTYDAGLWCLIGSSICSASGA